MSLDVNVRDDNGVSVIDISGRLTLGEGATKLRDDIRELVAEGKKRILLNLAGLTYMDSSGMGLLVGAYATVSREGGHLKLANLNSRIKDLLLITKLYAVFEIYEDEAAALGSFAVLTG